MPNKFAFFSLQKGTNHIIFFWESLVPCLRECEVSTGAVSSPGEVLQGPAVLHHAPAGAWRCHNSFTCLGLELSEAKMSWKFQRVPGSAGMSGVVFTKRKKYLQ